MEMLEHGDFEDFLEYFKHKTCVDDYQKVHKCFDKVKELSRSDTPQADSLIPDSNEEMYGLDWMVKYSNLSGPPKSTDALLFRKNHNENYALHIIEFKFVGFTHYDKMNSLWKDISYKIHCEKQQNSKNDSEDVNLKEIDSNQNSEELIDEECQNEECFNEDFINKFKKIKKDFKDPVQVSLQLKPYEVIFITLPKLYEYYCNENPEVERKDIVSYLNSIDKYYWAFVGNLSSSYYNINSKAKRFNEYSKRLEMTIFKKARVKPNRDFKKVLNKEIFENFDYGLF